MCGAQHARRAQWGVRASKIQGALTLLICRNIEFAAQFPNFAEELGCYISHRPCWVPGFLPIYILLRKILQQSLLKGFRSCKSLVWSRFLNCSVRNWLNSSLMPALLALSRTANIAKAALYRPFCRTPSASLPSLRRPQVLLCPISASASLHGARAVNSLVDSTRGAAVVHSSESTNLMDEFRNVRHRPKESLFLSTPTWWLKSRFHFSFAEYYNSENIDYGVLRVLNDDLVQPQSGFGTHPHRDAEIFTYIVEGELTHQDSMGSAETLGPGSVQYMSAGRGITHSEMNHGKETLHFLQIWIKPDRKSLTPNYGSRIFSKEDRHNKIQHVLTSYERYQAKKDAGTGLIPIHQDANIFVSEPDAGVQQEFMLHKRRQAYLVCIEGALTVNDKAHLTSGDSLEVEAVDANFSLKLNADKEKGAHFLLVEMALSQ